MIEATGVKLAPEWCEAGAGVVAKGVSTGVPRETIDSIARTGLAFKGPLETPVGTGAKSANVTLRKMFETYANVRPSRELPGVGGPFAGRGIDMITVRENVEDLYAGVEHMQTPDVAQCLKLITRKGSEKIVRLAFELARAEGRKRVACGHKANIMKLTEGLFLKVFREVAAEYPDIEASDIIIDNAAHRLVINPEKFDVLVCTNMNGDIISDLAAGLVGGLGVAPSANIGDGVAMFECVHGSAPDIAGQGKANPTALILTGAMMLRHIGAFAEAERIEAALSATLAAARVRTPDLAVAGARIVSTQGFAEAVAAAVVDAPVAAAPATRRGIAFPIPIRPAPRPSSRAVVGVDVFVESGHAPAELGPAIERAVEGLALKLKMISNRGTQVFPAAGPTPDWVEHHRCRFVARNAGAPVGDRDIAAVLAALASVASWNHVEKLATFDGERAYSLAQGEA